MNRIQPSSQSSTQSSDQKLAERIRAHAQPLLGRLSDFDPILEQIGDRSIVLLGEATHGTHEFYSARSAITRRLIEEKGFSAIALEADWPDALSINRFVTGHASDSQALDSLKAFQRFPMWMWRNSVVLDLIEWLWSHNHRETTAHKAGVYGIDLYSLYKSMKEVVTYLETVDRSAAKRARSLYSCFDHYGQDPVRYGRYVRVGAQESCERNAIKVATDLFERRQVDLANQSSHDSDEFFYAARNAELVINAESYYRNLFSPLVNTWNVRDRHMADTVDALLEHLQSQAQSQGRPAKIIIWAHNSHIGDDRATEMGWQGQWNIGQLLRERHPGDTFHLGFTTFEGTVTAATQWDHPPELKTVLPALPDSFEALFHRVLVPNFYLDLSSPEISGPLSEPRLERAIGVIYSPDTERISHYFQARLSEQFDAVMHFDDTREVSALDRLAQVEVSEPSEIQL